MIIKAQFTPVALLPQHFFNDQTQHRMRHSHEDDFFYCVQKNDVQYLRIQKNFIKKGVHQCNKQVT